MRESLEESDTQRDTPLLTLTRDFLKKAEPLCQQVDDGTLSYSEGEDKIKALLTDFGAELGLELVKNLIKGKP